MQNVEDIYLLAPMQQGMLFHSLYETKSGQYMPSLPDLELEPFSFEKSTTSFDLLSLCRRKPMVAYIFSGVTMPRCLLLTP